MAIVIDLVNKFYVVKTRRQKSPKKAGMWLAKPQGEHGCGISVGSISLPKNWEGYWFRVVLEPVKESELKEVIV